MNARPIVVLSQLPPPTHGSTVMTRMLVDVLVSSGESVWLFDKGFSRSLSDIGQLSGRKLLRALGLPLKLALDLLVRKPKIAIVFLNPARSAFLVDWLLTEILRFARVPYVVYLHGRGFAELGQSSRLLALLVRRVFRGSKRAILLSARLFGDIESACSRQKVMTIPNALPLDQQLQATERRATGGRVTFLYLSNFVAEKGAAQVLELARRTRDLSDRICFILAGGISDPDHYSQLTIDVEQHGLRGFVTVGGPVYADEKRRLFASADVFLFPSRYRLETFGLVNLEAMAAGLPIIASDVGGVADVVLDGSTGFVVPADDIAQWERRIRELAGDEPLRQRMGAEGRRHYEQTFTAGRFKENWQHALREFSATHA